MVCPQCHSDSVQKVSAVHAGGMSVGSAALGGPGGGDAAVLGGTAAQQSLLARRLAPAARPNRPLGQQILIAWGLIACIVPGVLLGVQWGRRVKVRRVQWAEALTAWQASYDCHRRDLVFPPVGALTP
jgi:hypothetical protein